MKKLLQYAKELVKNGLGFRYFIVQCKEVSDFPEIIVV